VCAAVRCPLFVHSCVEIPLDRCQSGAARYRHQDRQKSSAATAPSPARKYKYISLGHDELENDKKLTIHTHRWCLCNRLNKKLAAKIDRYIRIIGDHQA